MENRERGFFGNLAKNPFVVVLFAIVLGISVFVVFTLSKAVNNKIQMLEAEKTTAAPTTQASLPADEGENKSSVKVGTIKKYSDFVESISINKEANRLAVTVVFTDEGALLEEHFAQNAFSIEVVPVFHFYTEKGVQLEAPGELRLLSDSKSVVYYLSEIGDYANVLSLTEQTTVTFENILSNDFNLYIKHKTRDGVGQTLFGTYGQTVEQYNGIHTPVPTPYVEASEDISIVKSTLTDDYIWLDIYFKDEEAYNKYNSKTASKFIRFGLEDGGKLYKWDFFVTEYDNLNMLRCKFDSYSLAELLKEMEKEKLTVKDLFEDYDIAVWCSDYSTESDLFCLNEATDVRERISKSTTQN